MKRTNEKYREVFLVATGNQAMLKTGNISGSGSATNIASGQLGVIAATNEQAHLNAGDLLTSTNSPSGGANTAQHVPAIYICQGTPSSADTSQNVGWFYEDPNFVKSSIIRANTVRSFTGQVYALPVLSSTLFSGWSASNVESIKDYTVHTEFRSRRNDRDFGQNVENIPITIQTPDLTTLAPDDKLDYLITELVYRMNQQSKLWYDATSRGTRNFVTLAINSAGGNGTVIADIGLGDSVPFAVNANDTTLSLTVDRPMLNTLAELLDNTVGTLDSSSTIEVVDLDTSGNGKLATGTLTGTGNFTANDEVTIGTVVYKFVASPSSAYDVDLGGTLTVSLANLLAAINASGTAGTEYAAGTLENTQVDAISSDATTLVVRAKSNSTYSGTAGNAIVFDETTDGGGTWSLSGSGTLTGGTDINKDMFLVVGLQSSRSVGHDGIAEVNTRVDVEFGDRFQEVVNKPTKTVVTNSFEGYGGGTLLKVRYDRRAFGFTGTQQLAGFSDEVILAPNYISASTNYSVFVIDHYDTAETLTVRPQFQKRVYILLPATDDAATTDADAGITPSTSATNTVTDLQAILKPWLATSAAGGGAPELLGDATSSTYFA